MGSRGEWREGGMEGEFISGEMKEGFREIRKGRWRRWTHNARREEEARTTRYEIPKPFKNAVLPETK